MKADIDLMRENPALVHEIKCWRKDGATFDELQSGVAKAAIEDYPPAAVEELKRLTDPNK
jgi:hypothetical protein